jgi:hypothetical protein
MTADQTTKSDYCALFRNQRLVVLCLLFGYLAVMLGGALPISARRMLWHDELFTYYIATLPTFSQVWSALSTGQEVIPPAYYAIVRGSLAIFGNNNIALRLPALTGFLLMAVALFKFVSLRLPPIYGTIAALFPIVTGARYYMHEARPYGLELGFAALALLSWQRATEGRGRFAALAGLWFSLTAAISCHYYGLLLILPLAVGEMVRTVSRRRVDLGIWACFAASPLPLAFATPFILSGVKLVGTFWGQPHWSDVGHFYIDLLANSAPLIVASLLIAIVVPYFLQSQEPSTLEQNFPSHEIGAVLGLIALPFFAVLLAKFVTKAFTDRYVLSAVLGISVLFAQAMHKLLGSRFRIATGIALLFLAYFTASQFREITAANNDRSDFEKSIALLRSAGQENLPIVVGDPHTFVLLAHYAPPDVQSRLVYLASPILAGRLLGFTSVENGMVQLVGPWFHMNVIPFEAFLASNPKFFLYGAWLLNWVNRALIERGFRLEFLTRVENGPSDRYLFSVVAPPPPQGTMALPPALK